MYTSAKKGPVETDRDRLLVDPVPTRQETEMNIPALYACAGRLWVNNNKCRLVDGVHLSRFPSLTIETFSKTVVANMQKEFAKKSAWESLLKK